MYNSAPNCEGTFLCLESGECAPSLLSQVGAGWVFSSYKLATAAIDYYQKFTTVFYGTRSAVLLTSQYVKWICADVCFFFSVKCH